MERLKNFLESVFLWRSLKKFLWRPFFFFFGDRQKKFCENLFFFLESSCACVLGPWPWPRAFLSLASRVSVLGKAVLGLGLGFFLCPWPRAFCPRLHLWISHWHFLIEQLFINRRVSTELIEVSTSMWVCAMLRQNRNSDTSNSRLRPSQHVACGRRNWYEWVNNYLPRRPFPAK